MAMPPAYRGALADIPAWVEDTGNELLATAEEDGAIVFWIRKASDWIRKASDA